MCETQTHGKNTEGQNHLSTTNRSAAKISVLLEAYQTTDKKSYYVCNRKHGPLDNSPGKKSLKLKFYIIPLYKIDILLG